jgi:probable rRNA maturation factor
LNLLVSIEPRGVARKAPGLRKNITVCARAVLDSLECTEAELSIVLTDDAGIRDLNVRFRKIDRATDVLSFPLGDDVMLGDVVISVDTALRQATEFRVSTGEELCRLLVHGILHLLGFDHTTGGWQARRMKAREEEIMAMLKERGLFWE